MGNFNINACKIYQSVASTRSSLIPFIQDRLALRWAGLREAICEQFYLLNRWSVRETVRWATQETTTWSYWFGEVKSVTDTQCYTQNFGSRMAEWVGPKNSHSLVQDSYLVDPAICLSKIKPCKYKYTFEARILNQLSFVGKV
jgi:hypothetical protein